MCVCVCVCVLQVMKHYKYHMQLVLTLAHYIPWCLWYIFTEKCWNNVLAVCMYLMIWCGASVGIMNDKDQNAWNNQL